MQEEALEDPIQQIDFQTDYCKMRDITTYRNTAYRSGVTGTMAVVHHTLWMEAMDESMACFLGSGGKTRQSAA